MNVQCIIIDWLLRRDRKQAVDSHELVNLTILALTQIGLNVGTVLLASVMYKWYATPTNSESMPLHAWLCSYGWLAIGVSPVWLGVTISKRSNPNTSDTFNIGLVIVGWAIVAFWLWFAYRYVLVFPCEFSET
jgi:hypothetical protein